MLAVVLAHEGAALENSSHTWLGRKFLHDSVSVFASHAEQFIFGPNMSLVIVRMYVFELDNSYNKVKALPDSVLPNGHHLIAKRWIPCFIRP